MRLLLVLLLAFFAACGNLFAQDDDEEPFQEPEGIDFRISGEINAHYRWSEDDELILPFFPPDFVPRGRDHVSMRTVSPGSSLELSRATVFLEADFPRAIFGRIRIDFIDIYNRNPTSSDQKVDVEEAYLRFGAKYESLEPLPGSHLYALFGKAPKVERQLIRRLESYGLVATSFNRFNDVQLQVGGSLGSHVYFRAQVSSGNPTFFRDPNALAGDNGVELPPNPDITLESGFPILYHAEVEEIGFDDHLEGGFGAGVRFVSEDRRRGLDVLGFYYQTTLSEAAHLNGTFYEGDLDLLDGRGPSLPIEGDRRREWGFNVDAEFNGLGLFLQYVDEEVASLPRSGVELELGYEIATGDAGDPRALFTAIEPVLRVSRIENDFRAPRGFVAPSVMWDWTKIDVGVRVAILQNVDFLVEYAFHDIEASKQIGHDELLMTLRWAFP